MLDDQYYFIKGGAYLKKYSFILLLYLVCVFSWTILVQDITLSSIGFGFLLATIVLLFSGNLISDSDIPELELIYIYKFLKYSIYSIYNMYVNSLLSIKTIFKNENTVNIIELDLPSDIKLVNSMICNYISLNPGSVSLDKKDGKAVVMILKPLEESKKVIKNTFEQKYSSLITENVTSEGR